MTRPKGTVYRGETLCSSSGECQNTECEYRLSVVKGIHLERQGFTGVLYSVLQDTECCPGYIEHRRDND